MKQSLRLLLILRRLTDGVSVRDLAEQYDVDQKTIRRDLAELRAAGVRLKATTMPHGKKPYRLLRCPLCERRK